MEDKWKKEWRDYHNGNWTKRLVVDVCTFKRHGKSFITTFSLRLLLASAVVLFIY